MGFQYRNDTTRLLVLTDAGEASDNETALWLLAKHLNSAPRMRADVVFVTGNPLQRAMRWAGILNSCKGPKPGEKQMRYFIGPETERQMMYQIALDVDTLRSAGLGELDMSPYDGGSYDVVLQLSPLTGFSEDISPALDGVRGCLGRITARPGQRVPLYLVAQAEVNFLEDRLHKGFK